MNWFNGPSWPSRPSATTTWPPAWRASRRPGSSSAMRNVTSSVSPTRTLSEQGGWFSTILDMIKLFNILARFLQVVLESDLLYWAEDRGLRTKTANGQRIPREGRRRAPRDLPRCPGKSAIYGSKVHQCHWHSNFIRFRACLTSTSSPRRATQRVRCFTLRWRVTTSGTWPRLPLETPDPVSLYCWIFVCFAFP